MQLDLASLREIYGNGTKPAEVIDAVQNEIACGPLNPVWISVRSPEALARSAGEAGEQDPKSLPLYGVPFAVKDNIDVAGMPTTAGCPAFSYRPETTATVVRKLEAAGAILIGKTNMDQFATGLTGVRSPYGACSSVFDSAYISGGSSSGSAVAVARGLVSFSLGTDTAGSGRVPAAFNNIIGLKPTFGALSASGIVPACRSLDCVSVFASTGDDAWRIFEAARGFDSDYAFSRADDDCPAPWLASPFTFGIPHQDQLEFFGDIEAHHLYGRAVDAMVALGGEPVDFDLNPFREAAELLYAGPWVAERLAALKQFMADHSSDMNPVVRQIIETGSRFTAVDAFRAQYRLAALRAETAAVWRRANLLLLPTTGTTYTIDAVEADPIRLNNYLGYYTNFANLLDLSAVAVPAGFRPDGLPFGVTLFGQAFSEYALLTVCDRLRRSLGETADGAETKLASTDRSTSAAPPPGCTSIAVVGAHLSGQPLNHQLTRAGAALVERTRTSPGYRLYALPNTSPAKPGLVRDPQFMGPGIEVEVWWIPTKNFGAFVELVPPPLGIGTLELESGSSVKGFICEPFAVSGATEITVYGGWRAYLESRSS